MTEINKSNAALITGVSSGIGLAIAKDLLRQGYHVFGSVRRIEDANELTSLSEAFTPLVFDVTDSQALATAVTSVESTLGDQPLNVLINNAGIGLSGPIMLQPIDEIRKSFEVNVFALINVTRAFLPLLGARPNFKHAPGRIINIGSVSGSVTVPFTTTYSATKHAVEAIAQGFRRELMPYGIEVCTIEPGMIKTNLAATDGASTAKNNYAGSIYKDSWIEANKSMSQMMEKGKTPDVVTRAVNKILKAKKPKPRNPLDPSWYMGRILPDRVFDNLIFSSLKIKDLMMTKVNKLKD